LNYSFGDRARDNKSGFIVSERNVLESALLKIAKGKFNFPQTFIRVALTRERVSILEVESLFMPRLSGESFLSGFASLKASIQILVRDLPLALWVFRRSNYRPSYDLIPKDMLIKNGLTSLNLSTIRRMFLELYFSTMPFHKWIIRRSSRKYYLELLESQYFSESQLNRLQTERFKALLDHVYRNVPYYRYIFEKAGFHPSKFESLSDLDRIPLLSKEDVRKNLYFDLFSKDSKKTKLLKVSTSGSTGEPFVVYADRFQLEVRFATTLRQLHWTGWRFGDRQLRLWHQRIGMNATQVVKERIDAIFMRRKFIPAFEISESNINRFIRDIEKTKPVLMDGYAESLNFLASYLGSRNLTSRPKAIMSSAQILPEQSRQVIEQALGTRVFDKYGSREFSGIAYECAERPGYHHVMDESYILEILVEGRHAKPGEVGEIVITDLNNFSVPLIRYRIGDLAECVENELCKCGRSLKLIGKIQGRTQAIVYCADGVWMPGTFFAHFFKDYDSVIMQFQIYQAIKNEFEVRFIRGTDFSQQRLNEVIQELRKHVGDTKITLNEVEEIPLLITGKRSPVVSEIKSDFQKI
jgi:phenylacetate-CoA ligase